MKLTFIDWEIISKLCADLWSSEQGYSYININCMQKYVKELTVIINILSKIRVCKH